MRTLCTVRMGLKQSICVAIAIALSLLSILMSSMEYTNFKYLPPQMKNALKPNMTSGNNTVTVNTERPRRLQKYLTEQEVLKGNSYPNLLNISQSAKMKVLNNKSVYLMGEDIHLDIQLFDGYGRQRKVGGDYLRLWMENPAIGASVSGEVLDHNTGRYTGILKTVWRGPSNIKLSLAWHRTEIALYYRLYKQFSVIWRIYARFARQNLEENQECSNDCFKMGVSYCNFTDINYGLNWFCKHPTNPKLTCKDWVSSFSTTSAHGSSKDMTILKLNFSPEAGSFVVDTLSVIVHNEAADLNTHFPQSIPCNKLVPEQSWERISPKGYFFNNTWCSRLCQDTLRKNRNTYGECLRGRTLWIPGDSTSYQIYRSLLSMYPESTPTTVERHHPSSFRNENFKFEIQWHPHEMPFANGVVPNNRTSTKAEHLILETLPSSTQDIVVLYLYVHFTLVHPDMFRQHVRRLISAAERLLTRAPNVTVAVRGPHAFYKPLSVGLSSYWGLLYTDILHEEFYPLRTKVLYIDFWDLTVAKASRNIHPQKPVVDVMVHTLMSILCFRK